MPGRTIWPPCVWPLSISGSDSPAASLRRDGLCASRIDAFAAPRGDARDITRARRPVPDADEVERLPADREARALVSQDFDASRRHRHRHVAIVVVIAQNAKDAVRSRQRPHGIGRRLDEVPIAANGQIAPPRHIVATEDDQVRAFGHQQSSRRRDQVVRHGGTAVQVGHEPDSQPGERCGEAGDA